jgi:mRNA interferase HigB
MKVRLIKRAAIKDYIFRHARSKSSMETFLQLLKVADWNIPVDVKSTFGKRADLICNGKRIVFDVGGGGFRIICGLVFGVQSVFLYVKFIGTHAAYDKLCKPGKNEPGVCDVDVYKSKSK